MHVDDKDERIVLLLDYPRAADALSLSEQALRDLVWKGRGPVVTEIGRRRMFSRKDLEEFVERNRRPPTPPDVSGGTPPRGRRGRRPR